MKLPRIRDLEGLSLIVAAVAVGLTAAAWRNSHRGGYPFFSLETVTSIWPLLAVAFVVVAANLASKDNGQ